MTGLTCYRCGGNGRDPNLQTEKLYTADKLVKLNVTKAKKDAERARIAAQKAAAEAARVLREKEEVLGNYSDTIKRIRAAAPVKIDGDGEEIDPLAGEGFLGSLYRQITIQARRLSEAQQEALDRVLDKIEAEQARRAAATHVGTVGERRDFTLTLMRINSFGDQWAPGGLTYICTFRDENGCTVIYKGNSPHSLGLKSVYNAELRYSETTVGQVIRVKASIKDHTYYKNEPQTVISRPKALEMVE